ncbi:MAG: glycosyltransferase family 9 protein, partial [Salibacteraceae bacterium]|nr:glycosyltransferase family 9 protein [Salibacteraceae bacterium]
ILIIRFSSIGDIVLTTPIVRALKQQLDGEVILHYITKKSYAGLLTSNPNVDHVIAIDKHVSEAKAELEKTQYDYVIDLHSNLRSRQVKRIVKTLDFTLDKRNLAKWLYVNFKRELLPIEHVVKRGFDAVKALGIEDDGQGLDYFIPTQDEVDLKTISSALKNGFVAYAIGGQMLGKILPEDKIISLCAKIEKPIVLLGGPEDAERAERILAAIATKVFNACGKFNLNQSASILAQADVVLTHDTGLMHIASALKKKVVSLWFATTPQIGFAPWQPGEGSVMIEADCKKRPTSKLGNRGFEDGCVFNIDLDAVAKAVNT